MKRLITGIQNSGSIHLGNIAGALEPIIELSKENETLLFVADLHSLTTLKDAKEHQSNTHSLTSAILSFGFDTDKNILYKQSDIPNIGNLAFIFNCLAPYKMISNSHAFKDKSENLEDINVGLFTYPTLMAADILLFDVDYVPVGNDQKQHLEITRDLAKKFNNAYGNTFKLPEAIIKNENVLTGLDGRKMSKSYQNYIDIFLPEKKLLKIIRSIVTDSTPLGDPKNYNECNLFKIYSYLISETNKKDLISRYNNGVSYGEIKDELYEFILLKYKTEREKYNEYINQPLLIKSILENGAKKANMISSNTMKKIKDNMLM